MEHLTTRRMILNTLALNILIVVTSMVVDVVLTNIIRLALLVKVILLPMVKVILTTHWLVLYMAMLL